MPTCATALEGTRNICAMVHSRPLSLSRPKCRTYKDHRQETHENLRVELHQSSINRGVQYNKYLSKEEIENFRDSYRALMSRVNDPGVENRVLAHSFLQTNIYKAKVDAIKLVKLLPGSSQGMVSCDAILEAANDINIHQRGLLKRFIRVLPLTPIDLDDMSVSTGSLRFSWRLDRLPYPV